MRKEELKIELEINKSSIYGLNEKLEQVSNFKEEKKLLTELKELQIKQMWLLDQLEAW